MAPPPRKTIGDPGVSAELILQTAAQLIEIDGVKALTMRNLADQLGVAVTSIYWHIGGRDQLLDSLVERLLGELANLPVDGDGPVAHVLVRRERGRWDTAAAMRGVSSARDVIEMMMAGATAVEVGAANLKNPYICKEIIEALPSEMERLGIERLADIVGCAAR